MKRIYTLSLLAAFLFCYSCHKDELVEEDTEKANLQVTEYFFAKINGVDFRLSDPGEMGGTIYPSPESKVITFDFWGEKDAKDHYEAIFFKICFYEGPGTYYTGNNYNVSYADYLSNWDAWYNDYRLKDPGEVIITKASETFVEGTFTFNAYNYETFDLVNIEGSFGVALEENLYGY